MLYQCHARTLAGNLEAERKARDRAVRAIIDAAAVGLMGAPGIGLHAHLRGSKEPEAAPCDRGDQEQEGSDVQPPARTPFRRNHHIGHPRPFDEQFWQ